MLLVALEEWLLGRSRLCGVYAIHSPGAPRGNVEPALGVKLQIPDVMGLRILAVGVLVIIRLGLCLRFLFLVTRDFGEIEDHRGIRFVLLGRGVGFHLVHPAAGHGGGIQSPIGAELQRLHGQVAGFKQREWLAVRAYALNRGWRSGPQVRHAFLVHREGPHEGRRSGKRLFEDRAFAQVSIARNRDPLGSAFLKVIEARLSPEMGSLRVRRRSVRGRQCGRKNGEGECETKGNSRVAGF